ncbi:sulfatase [Candidatus Halobonum tyrrellensis G22]|uniref:Sulfatase n=2 Tax=Candidatus Halobonum TaxID=1431544 RepID=V4HGH0_9EURY|nr:sulfatase [Candidatus Halobonum tyrrellensis G22]
MERIATAPKGAAFDDCFSHAIWSQPSITSMLTGTYPSAHGAGLHNEVLPSEIEPVSTRFDRAGYTTAGLSINPFFSEATQLDRGFDRFRAITSVKDFLTRDSVVPALKYLRRIRSHSAGFSTEVSKHRQDFVVNEIAKRWISDLAEGDDPFFMYAHYQGAHYPYYAPPQWAEEFVAGETEMSLEEAMAFAYDRSSNIYREIANGCAYTDDEWAALQAVYDASVAYSDWLVGELFDHLQAEGMENTVLVVTADHGDLLGEHGLISHNLSTDDALLHVPAVTYGFPDVGSRTDEVVQHIDLIETLVAAGGASTNGMAGYDLREESRPYAVSQRGKETRDRTFTRAQEFNPEFTSHPDVHDSLVTALRTAEYKYVRSDDRTELFNLPDETTDVSDDHPDVRDEFDGLYDDWFDRYGQPVESTASASHSDAAKQRLEDLGYVMDG